MLLDGRRGEVSRFQSKEIESQKIEPISADINQTSVKSNPKCRYCGKNSHSQDAVCPARGKECRKCGKFNHFAKACLSKSNNSRSNSGSNSVRKFNKQKNNKSLHPISHSDSESEENYLYAVKTKQKRRP